jgi:hypothetical protein
MPNVHGQIYFSSTTFDRNPNGWNDSLRNNYYREGTRSGNALAARAKKPEALTFCQLITFQTLVRYSGAAVLILQVISMFPHINTQDGCAFYFGHFHQRVVLVGSGGYFQLCRLLQSAMPSRCQSG